MAAITSNLAMNSKTVYPEYIEDKDRTFFKKLHVANSTASRPRRL
jgi:hypothetical protein